MKHSWSCRTCSLNWRSCIGIWQLSDARSWHNDRDLAVAGTTVGGFPNGLDDEYFIVLQVFVDLVHSATVGGPWPFSTFAKIDTDLFLADLQRWTTPTTL